MQEHELELMIDSWRRLDGESRSHVATQLRQEVIDRLRYGEEIPEALADWLADALEQKNPELFAEPWKKLFPAATRHRQMEMAIMARILKNRPDLWREKPNPFKDFMAATADIFADSVDAISHAYAEYRDMLDFLEQGMGMKHLPTKSDILAYREKELAQVAEALEETVRDKKYLASCLTSCLKTPLEKDPPPTSAE